MPREIKMSAVFFQNLQTASWRNIPFGVSSIALSLGRKIAVHDYPYVDGVYAEDLGMRGKIFHIQGFIVEGGGAYGRAGTLREQMEAFEQAASQWGDGVFVHPTLGMRPKMCLQGMEIEQDLQGRVATIRFSLIENIVSPSSMSNEDTKAKTIAYAGIARDMSIVGVLTSIKGAVRSYRNGILTVVNRFSTQVRQVVFTATSLFSMITSLPGEIGRYIGSSVQDIKKLNKNVDQLIGLGSASRVNVINHLDTLEKALYDMNVEEITKGISGTITAVYEANPDPVQALNAMLPFANATSMQADTEDGKGFNLLTDLIRRSAVICIAESTANREYISYDDALDTRTLVCGLLDNELKIAGDQGLDDTFNALMNLRTCVSKDLTMRGADLATVETIVAATSLPSLVWSQKLYQDSGREKELVKSANPIHPAFMPINFKALSS